MRNCVLDENRPDLISMLALSRLEPVCFTDCKAPLGKCVICDIGLFQMYLTCLDLTSIGFIYKPFVYWRNDEDIYLLLHDNLNILHL